MKILSTFILSSGILLRCNVQAQTETASAPIDTQKASDYFLSLPGCGCLPPAMFQKDKDGRPLLPAGHPDAKYFNDPQYWYWQSVDDKYPQFGGIWDVKPEYMDSIPDGSGGWLKAAFWTIARWKKEEPEERLP